MRPFQRGQIWLVDFDPSVGHEYKKVRPALIIQHDRYIPLSTLVSVIPLSDQTDKEEDGNLTIWERAEIVRENYPANKPSEIY